MEGRVFVDTNVLVYLFDRRDLRKHERARRVLEWMDEGSLVVSTQVLSEFSSTISRKLTPAMPMAVLAKVVADLSCNPVVVVDPPLIVAAGKRRSEDRLSFWDALIVESALSAGCERLLTEDLQHGQAFGSLRVENPFLP